MKASAVTLLLVFLASIASISRAINPCLYNREDYLPCLDHLNAGVVSPGDNQYTIHATRFQGDAITGLPICVKRKEGEILRTIEDLGTPQNKFIFSPGAEQNLDYINQIVVEYKVQCQQSTTAFIQFDSFNLEPSNCHDGSQLRCRDYIQIDAGSGGLGITEYCGNNLPSQPFLVGTGHFTIKLRTSFYNGYPGFRIFVTCFSTSLASIDPTTCTSPGGLAKKRAAYELVDLSSSVEQQLSVDSVKRPRPQPITLTSADLSMIRSLTQSLFNVALSKAQQTISSWPPPSYSRNDPNDILDINELNKSTILNPVTLSTPRTPISLPSLTPDIIKPSEAPYLIRPLPLEATIQRRRRLSNTQGSLVQLDSEATLEAVRYEEACNPILRSVTSSYLTVAQRLAPTQLQTARSVFRQELAEKDTVLTNQDLSIQPAQPLSQ